MDDVEFDTRLFVSEMSWMDIILVLVGVAKDKRKDG